MFFRRDSALFSAGLLIFLCAATSSAQSKVEKEEAAVRSTQAAEKSIFELLELSRCREAIDQLHRIYTENPSPRFQLWYGRAFQQCVERGKARESFKAVMANYQLFTAEELNEARLHVDPEVSLTAQSDRARLEKLAIKGNSHGLMVVGGILLAAGVATAIAGGVIGTRDCSGGSCIGNKLLGTLIGGLGGVILVIPGGIMLGAGARDP